METIGEINQTEKCVVEWKIKDLFSLSTEDGINYSSPLFEFANSSWFLKIHPNGSPWNKSEGCFNLHRMSSGPPITVEYQFGMKILDENFDSKSDIEIIFYKEKLSYGFEALLSRSKVLEASFHIPFKNTVTLVCHLKFSRCTDVEREETSTIRKNKALQDYKELFLKRKYCDVIIKVKDQKIPAHRFILAARSPVFESTFRNDMKEKRTSIIDIEDFDASTFSDFLCFLYCGDTQIITVENVFDLFAAADKYDVSDLRVRCFEFMKENLSIDTFCDTMNLALQYSENELTELTNFFSYHGLEIIKTAKWRSFLASHPTQSNELVIKTFESFKDRKNLFHIPSNFSEK